MFEGLWFFMFFILFIIYPLSEIFFNRMHDTISTILPELPDFQRLYTIMNVWRYVFFLYFFLLYFINVPAFWDYFQLNVSNHHHNAWTAWLPVTLYNNECLRVCECDGSCYWKEFVYIVLRIDTITDRLLLPTQKCCLIVA